VAEDNYDSIQTDGQERAIEVPIDQKRGVIFLASFSYGIAIRTELWEGNASIDKCSCLLTQNSDKKFSIQGFQR
jgi:hypothetical protein